MATSTRYARCTCSDTEHIHLLNRSELRAFCDSPDRVDGVPVWVDGEAPDFDDAAEAEHWLWAHDLEDQIELAHEWDLEHFGRGGRI